MKPAKDDARLYEKVASHVARLVDQGALRPGDRLPSVRRLASQQGVSVATVLQAYLQLENRGLIEARPQSGHYVRLRPAAPLSEPRAPRPSSTPSRVSNGALVARIYGAARDPLVVPMGAVTPSPELLPARKLSGMVAALARSAPGVAVSYDPPPGCASLRKQLARRAAAVGCALGPDDFVTTVGAMEALHISLRAVTRPGDAVAIESPAYYVLFPLMASLGVRVVEIPAHPRYGMDLDALEQALGQIAIKACLATPNFSNPLGALMPDEAKEKLVELLGRREVPLIEDDIYGDLHFEGQRPRPAKAFDRRGLVMLCSSFSKTLAPGFRVGWVSPGRFQDAVEQLKFAQSVATPTLPQLAIAEFLESGGYERHLRGLRRQLADQVARVSDAVARYFPPGTRVSRPAGGYMLWVELPQGTSALELFEAALSRGISLVPGPVCSAKPRFSSFVRLSCGHPYSEVFDRALQTLGRLASGLGQRGHARTA